MPFRARLTSLLVLFYSHAVCPLQAERTGARSTEAALPPEIQHQVEALKNGFAEYVLQNAQGPYERNLKTLNTQVRPLLEHARDAVAAKKDLDALVRIKAAITRIDNGEPLTATADPPPESLKLLYATYRLEFGKLVLARKASLADARLRYDKGLQDIQDALTSAQKIEPALQVKRLREELPQMKDEALLQAFQAEKAPIIPMPESGTAAAPKATPAAISLGADIPKNWSYLIEPEGTPRGSLKLTEDGRVEFTGMHKNPDTGLWGKKVEQGTWTKGKKLNELIITYPDRSWEIQIENGLGKMVSGIGTRYLKPVP